MHSTNFLLSIGFLLAISGCNSSTQKNNSPKIQKDTAQERHQTIIIPTDTSELEYYFIEKKLVNVQELDSTIQVALLYATSHNFLHKVVYKDLTKCYLPCEVAIKLCNAQHYLQQDYPQYHIIVFDAVRPLHIQQQMWDELDMPIAQKINYLANPKDISLHNYGAAVDVGIISKNQLLLDMGTPFDSFNELSQPKKEFTIFSGRKVTSGGLCKPVAS